MNWDTNSIAYLVRKVSYLWFENVEFGDSVPWDEFIAGFSANEIKVFNYFG